MARAARVCLLRNLPWLPFAHKMQVSPQIWSPQLKPHFLTRPQVPSTAPESPFHTESHLLHQPCWDTHPLKGREMPPPAGREEGLGQVCPSE